MIALYGDHSDMLFGTGTGFLVSTAIGPCLVTARHCVTGRDHYSGMLNAESAIPTRMKVYHRVINEQGCLAEQALITEELLYGPDAAPVWYEHHKYKDLCDFVVVPLRDLRSELSLNFVDTGFGRVELSVAPPGGMQVADDMRVGITPGEQLSVIGFPFGGFTGSVWPIWASGFLAAELESNDGPGPAYVDCRARPGQSGSPVYVKRRGEVPLIDGEHALIDGVSYTFLGIYSGRINSESDIGIVWPAQGLTRTIELLPNLARASMPFQRFIGSPISRVAR